jgi:hypothetical protein
MYHHTIAKNPLHLLQMLPHAGIRYKEEGTRVEEVEPRSGVNIFFKCGLLNGLQGKKKKYFGGNRV